MATRIVASDKGEELARVSIAYIENGPTLMMRVQVLLREPEPSRFLISEARALAEAIEGTIREVERQTP